MLFCSARSEIEGSGRIEWSTIIALGSWEIRSEAGKRSGSSRLGQLLCIVWVCWYYLQGLSFGNGAH
jgi:hypothetical protein